MKKLISITALLFSTSVFAAGDGMKSEDMFVPKAGGHEFFGGLTIPTGKVDFTGGSSTTSGMGLSLNYAYGFTDMLALDVNQGYSSYSTSTSPATTTAKVSGIGGTAIGVKGMMSESTHFLYYGAYYRMGILNTSKTTVATNGDTDSTPVDERPSLNLNFGGAANVGMFNLGGMLEYSLYQDGDTKSDAAGVTTTTKHKSGSGMRWKLFGQMDMGWKLGLSYQESVVEAYDTETAGVTTKAVKSEQKRLAIYGIIPVADMDVLVSLAKPEPKDITGQTWSYYELTAALRMSF